MKSISFLFTLIISLGFVACQNQPKSADANTSTPTLEPAKSELTDGTYCFEYRFVKDVNTVNLVVNGNTITGEMNWIPFEKDGGRGTLQGTRNGNEITAIWSYVIEGSNQTEEVMFKVEGEQLIRKTGELVDEKNDGNLKLKDPAAAQYDEIYTKVTCP